MVHRQVRSKLDDRVLGCQHQGGPAGDSHRLGALADAAIVHGRRPMQPLAGEDPPVQLDQAAARCAAHHLDLPLTLGL